METKKQRGRADVSRRTTHISLPVAVRRGAKARACLREQTLAEYVAELVTSDLRAAGMAEMLGTEEMTPAS